MAVLGGGDGGGGFRSGVGVGVVGGVWGSIFGVLPWLGRRRALRPVSERRFLLVVKVLRRSHTGAW